MRESRCPVLTTKGDAEYHPRDLLGNWNNSHTGFSGAEPVSTRMAVDTLGVGPVSKADRILAINAGWEWGAQNPRARRFGGHSSGPQVIVNAAVRVRAPGCAATT